MRKIKHQERIENMKSNVIMRQKTVISTKTVVMTAFFAAITFLGIQSFRIPLPAAVGTPFVHFGHIFVVMGVLLQGGKRGAVSGTIGLVVFDLLNGYLHAMPQVFVETIVKCLIVGSIFTLWKKKHDESQEYSGAVICSVIYGCMNIVIEFIMGVVQMMIVGSEFKSAVVASATSIPATIINVVFLVAGIAALYKPVKKVYQRVK